MSTIVSIHSFRGGTGKSNITANIAAHTALAGYRVGIIDTDINSPGIHVLFGLDEKTMGHTLNEFLHGQCTIEEAAYAVGEHAVGDPGIGRQKLAGKCLYLVPSSIKSEEITQVLKDGYDVGRLNEGINSLLKNLKLDYLFIDTHPGLNEETLLSIALSDILIIIMRPDRQDFQGTAVTVDIARGLDVPHLYMVVNKALTRYDFNQVRQQVENEYQATVAGVFPLSEDIADLASTDIFSLCSPDHLWSRTARQISKTIMDAAS
jgi:MinD-like ATPase involved in chromosome partitioning or flagellar assembly